MITLGEKRESKREQERWRCGYLGRGPGSCRLMRTRWLWSARYLPSKDSEQYIHATAALQARPYTLSSCCSICFTCVQSYPCGWRDRWRVSGHRDRHWAGIVTGYRTQTLCPGKCNPFTPRFRTVRRSLARTLMSGGSEASLPSPSSDPSHGADEQEAMRHRLTRWSVPPLRRGHM